MAFYKLDQPDVIELNHPDVIERTALSIVQGLEEGRGVNIRYLSAKDLAAGRIPLLEDKFIKVGCHPHCEISYVTRGQGIIAIEDKIFDAEAGDLFIVKPHEIHGIQPNWDDPFDIAWFGIHPQEMAGWVSTYFGKQIEEARRPIIHLGKTYELWDIVEEVLKEIVFHSLRYEMVLRIELLHLFIAFARKVKVVMGEEKPLNLDEILPKQGRKRWREAVEVAIRYIKENYFRKIDLGTVAEKAFLSPNHFCEVFKAETGVTFTEYLRRTRIAEAKRLLGDTQLNISEISERVGYESIHYFSRLFKEHEGLSPSEYRELLK